ncbi:DUF397 domain-containing protein [Saccharothrix australiensis]|uniref:Uncharacterized protein DUF397 n=1 Tax=Saccharothrix australiensis TaxID=2072 RepID=A0A495VQP8_9PSEU|nr:DUF397 domain-containing protein [Saccharothrix australiensis]RKT51721.1 uncharacterized protein DUF397 [Saccharothrix australiensis]
MTRDTEWFKSSRSAAGSDACVEVRFTETTVGVRDSKDTAGPEFSFGLHAWRSFLTSAKRH